MFTWLRRLLTADADNKRLNAEVAFWRTQFDEIVKQKLLSDQRFIREVNSNRRREDSLADMLRQSSGGPGRLPGRETEDLMPAMIIQPDLFVADDESAVLEIATQMWEQAKENGQDYDFNVLCETIRKNKAEYLI